MDDINEQKLEDDISFDKYRYLLELKKEKEMDELIKNKNLSIQEKIIINLENELNQLKLDQKNITYSNDEMLRLYPNDKDVIESREINLVIYNKNEKRIKEIEQKLQYLSKNSEDKKDSIKENICNEGKTDNISIDNNKKEDDKSQNNKTEDILKELEL